MTTYEYTGVIEMIGDTQSFGANGFTKRELVVGNDVGSTNKYPNPVLFTAKKDQCALLDAVKTGDRVTVRFTVDGRKWDGPNGTRYFTDLTIWKVEPLAKSEDAADHSGAPNWAEAKEAYSRACGIAVTDARFAAAFKAFCLETIPGKASKDYTAADTAKISATAAVMPSPEALEELPF